MWVNFATKWFTEAPCSTGTCLDLGTVGEVGLYPTTNRVNTLGRRLKYLSPWTKE
jgi:hypothetical protein